MGNVVYSGRLVGRFFFPGFHGFNSFVLKELSTVYPNIGNNCNRLSKERLKMIFAEFKMIFTESFMIFVWFRMFFVWSYMISA
jgi:hypothetical protein